VTFVETAAIVFLLAGILTRKRRLTRHSRLHHNIARQRRQEPAPFHLPNAENRTATSFPLLN
jgi:hypothetical protein